MAISKSDLFSADTVFTGGKIISVDEGFSIAQALAVKGGMIVAVGTNEVVRAPAGPRT